MKTLIVSISAALMALSTAAHAQDAYISQIGDDLSAVNYSEYNQSGNQNRDNMQVTAQMGVGFQAATLTRGSNNTAHTYQLDLTDNYANGTGTSGATMESLVWQKGGFNTGNNTAVAVQLANQSPGTQGTYVSQILQEGTNNTAINWAQNAGTNWFGNTSLASIVTPTLALTPSREALPSVSAVTVPFGTTVNVSN